MDPFGWRVAAAVVGSLMVLVMCRLARRMTGSTALGLVAGLLLSLDGLQFVLSRLALLDIFLAFFILCAVSCLVADRDWYRAKMARLVPEQVDRPGVVRPGAAAAVPALAAGQRHLLGAGDRHQVDGDLPAGGVRRHGLAVERRRAAVVRRALGDAALDRHRRRPGVRPPRRHRRDRLHRDLDRLAGARRTSTRSRCRRRSTPSSSRSGPARWTTTARPQENNLDNSGKRWPTASEPDAHGVGEVVQSLRSLYYYHRDVYTFHTHFLNCSTHTYASKPSGWLLLNRPVGVAADTGIEPGHPRLRRARGQHLPQAGAADRHADDLVGRHPGAAVRRGDVGRRAATGGSAWPWSAPRRPGCRGCSTTAGRSSCSTPSRPCRSWCSR